MKLWQRALLVVIALAALYAMWRFPVAGVGAVLMGAVAVWLGRGLFRSKLAANPMGENRDYSLRPGAVAAAKGAGLFVAAMLWAALGASAVRLKYIPDTTIGALIVVGPVLLLLGMGAVYLFLAVVRFMYGGKPPQGGFK